MSDQALFPTARTAAVPHYTPSRARLWRTEDRVAGGWILPLAWLLFGGAIFAQPAIY